MALWQFRLSCYPREALMALYGSVPNIMESEIALPGRAPMLVADNDTSEFDFWASRDFHQTCDEVRSVLNEMKSWSKDARMFGSDDGDRIEVWDTFFHCHIDCRSLNIPFIEKLEAMLQKLNLVAYDGRTGNIVKNDCQSMLDAINGSISMRFVREPYKVLDCLSQQPDLDEA